MKTNEEEEELLSLSRAPANIIFRLGMENSSVCMYLFLGSIIEGLIEWNAPSYTCRIVETKIKKKHSMTSFDWVKTTRCFSGET